MLLGVLDITPLRATQMERSTWNMQGKLGVYGGSQGVGVYGLFSILWVTLG